MQDTALFAFCLHEDRLQESFKSTLFQAVVGVLDYLTSNTLSTNRIILINLQLSKAFHFHMQHLRINSTLNSSVFSLVAF